MALNLLVLAGAVLTEVLHNHIVDTGGNNELPSIAMRHSLNAIHDKQQETINNLQKKLESGEIKSKNAQKELEKEIERMQSNMENTINALNNTHQELMNDMILQFEENENKAAKMKEKLEKK
eukprot:127071_1